MAKAPEPKQGVNFEHELEVFRREVGAAIQFLYAHVAVRSVMTQHQPVLDFLNQASLFWATSLGALQLSAFIALGRIFDHDSTHNVSRLLRIAQNHPDIFSKEALARRKERDSPGASKWLPDYLSKAYEPTPHDFRRLKAHVSKWRKVYEKNYRPIRNKVFAHREISDPDVTAAMFAQTNIREMQRLFTFLNRLYEALWQQLNNGYKPVLRPQRYSVKRMRDKPSPGGDAVQEIITAEVEQFLMTAAGVTKPPKKSRRVAGHSGK